jgi:hypothetical protein
MNRPSTAVPHPSLQFTRAEPRRLACYAQAPSQRQSADRIAPIGAYRAPYLSHNPPADLRTKLAQLGTGSPCSSRTGSPAMCGRSPRCWTSSGTPWLPSPRESSSSARPADVGQPLPDRISRTDWPSDGRPSAGAPCPARQNRHLGAAPRAKRVGGTGARSAATCALGPGWRPSLSVIRS